MMRSGGFRIRSWCYACWITAVLGPFVAASEVTYQGRLDQAGVAANGTFDVRFTLYDALNAGNGVGTPICKDQVAVDDGQFTTSIDIDDAVLDGRSLWIEVAVRADGTSGNCGAGSFTVLSPRQPLSYAPYSISAKTVQLPLELNADISNTFGDGHVVSIRNPNIDALVLRLIAPNPSSVPSYGLWSEVAGLGGRAILGLATDSQGGGAANYGVWGQAAGPGGRGVYGYATNPSGSNYGVRGRTESASGWAGFFEGRGYFSGRLGVGTTAPGYPLHIIGGDQFMQRVTSSNVNGTWLDLQNTSAGGNVWSILSTGSSNGEGAGDLVIRVPAALALDIDTTGYVGFGDNTPTFRIELPNVADNSGRGRANSWTTYSSRRWKHNVRTLDGALGQVLRLRGVSFDWNAEHGGKADIGFVAEEVGAVIPEIVSWEANGTDAQSLAYDRITALTVEAIKQQQARIDEQGREIEELKSQLAELRKEMRGGR
ncbi:MAG: tail fiber domain-containing protein [Phycisphaerales bacterium]|nr:tail fiber domain-containing protein [Phycisphaerales bacterium]